MPNAVFLIRARIDFQKVHFFRSAPQVRPDLYGPGLIISDHVVQTFRYQSPVIPEDLYLRSQLELIFKTELRYGMFEKQRHFRGRVRHCGVYLTRYGLVSVHYDVRAVLARLLGDEQILALADQHLRNG